MAAAAPASAVRSTSIADLLAMDHFALSPKRQEARTTADRWMRRIGLPLGVGVFLAVAFAPSLGGLTSAGQLSAAAFALALVWWICEPIPTHVTSLVLMV